MDKAWLAPCGEGVFMIPLTIVIIITDDWDYGGSLITVKKIKISL